MNIKLVVFDMAGTTVDEDNIVYKTVQKAINEAGFNVSLKQVLAEGAGKEKLQAIKSVLSTYANTTNDVLAEKIYDNFIVQLKEAYTAQELFPQPHATEVCAGLKEKNILTVLNTGYDKPTAEQILNKLGWKEGETFDGLITATDVAKNRPDPDMILLAMKRFGVEDSRTVAKVGDSAIDIEEGQNANCGLSIGITTGAHTPEQLQIANPDYIINDLIELLPIVAG